MPPANLNDKAVIDCLYGGFAALLAGGIFMSLFFLHKDNKHPMHKFCGFYPPVMAAISYLATTEGVGIVVTYSGNTIFSVRYMENLVSMPLLMLSLSTLVGDGSWTFTGICSMLTLLSALSDFCGAAVQAHRLMFSIYSGFFFLACSICLFLKNQKIDKRVHEEFHKFHFTAIALWGALGVAARLFWILGPDGYRMMPPKVFYGCSIVIEFGIKAGVPVWLCRGNKSLSTHDSAEWMMRRLPDRVFGVPATEPHEPLYKVFVPHHRPHEEDEYYE